MPPLLQHFWPLHLHLQVISAMRRPFQAICVGVRSPPPPPHPLAAPPPLKVARKREGVGVWPVAATPVGWVSSNVEDLFRFVYSELPADIATCPTHSTYTTWYTKHYTHAHTHNLEHSIYDLVHKPMDLSCQPVLESVLLWPVCAVRQSFSRAVGVRLGGEGCEANEGHKANANLRLKFPVRHVLLVRSHAAHFTGAMGICSLHQLRSEGVSRHWQDLPP